MSKLLKGNYDLEGTAGEKEKKSDEQALSELFESKALEKLGGSIAFVMKSNKFVWDEDKDAE
jgi:hypothetical protein